MDKQKFESREDSKTEISDSEALAEEMRVERLLAGFLKSLIEEQKFES